MNLQYGWEIAYARAFKGGLRVCGRLMNEPNTFDIVPSTIYKFTT